MRLAAFVVALLMVTSWVPAFAQNANTPQAQVPAEGSPSAPGKKTDYVVAPAHTEVIEPDSSAYNRLEKKVDIDVILFGLGPSFTSANGLQAGYFISRNSLVLLELTNGSLNGTTSASVAGSQSGSSLDVKTSSLGVHFKHFTGNSFYYRAGLDFRRVDESYSYTSTTTDYYKFKGTSIAANFQIGNQWQWSNFTLGCDWVGISVPLSSTITDEQLSTTAPSYYQDWQKSDEDLFVKKSNLTLLRFYLGASF